MKNFLLYLFALCFSANYSQTLLLNENFDYGSAQNANILSVTTNWANHSGTQNPQYAFPGLSYSGYPSSNIGGAISFTAGSSGINDGDVNRTFTDITTGSTIYASFLVNFTAAKGSADYFFHLGQNPFSTSAFRCKVFAVANGAGWNIGLGKQSSAGTINSAVLLSFGQTYLIVLKYQFSTATLSDDLVSLYVYSGGMPTSESSASLLSITNINDGANDPNDIGAIAVRQGSNCPTGLIDGIRVANNWGLAVIGTATAVAENISEIPTKFELMQNYPNPFNPETVISYRLPVASQVRLSVFDLLGREAAVLVDEYQDAGVYNSQFSTCLPAGKVIHYQFSSGIYFYQLRAGAFAETKKMMLIK